MSVVFGFDATAVNYASLPATGQRAGYDTGSDGIAWTQAMWDESPGALHIDQAPDTANLEAISRAARAGRSYWAGHVTADILDVENGAVPVGSPLIPAWTRGATASFAAATRPGQRTPVLYQSADNVTANVNALIAGGITSGAGLFIADWGITDAQAVAELQAAAGPFPIIGLQVADLGNYDADVFSAAWLADVSGGAATWSFGPLAGFKLAAVGPHSLKVEFSAPQAFIGVPPVPAPGITQYQMAVSQGPRLAADIAGYPRFLDKGPNPETWEEGGLEPGTQYTAGVRAYGTHSGPWSTATFTAPAS